MSDMRDELRVDETGKDLRFDEILRPRPKLDIVREIERVAPIDNLLISLPTILCTERWPPNQAFEHDGPNTPPVTAKGVALAAKDFRGDVVWSTDS